MQLHARSSPRKPAGCRLKPPPMPAPPWQTTQSRSMWQLTQALRFRCASNAWCPGRRSGLAPNRLRRVEARRALRAGRAALRHADAQVTAEAEALLAVAARALLRRHAAPRRRACSGSRSGGCSAGGRARRGSRCRSPPCGSSRRTASRSPATYLWRSTKSGPCSALWSQRGGLQRRRSAKTVFDDGRRCRRAALACGTSRTRPSRRRAPRRRASGGSRSSRACAASDRASRARAPARRRGTAGS